MSFTLKKSFLPGMLIKLINVTKFYSQGPPYRFVAFPTICRPTNLQPFKLKSFMKAPWKPLNPLNNVSNAYEPGCIFRV